MRLLLLLLLLILCAPALAVDINVTPASVGTTYIEWQWDAGYNLTHILIDGVEICGYETTDNTILRSSLSPSSTHTINVTNGTFYGDNTTMTLSQVSVSGSGAENPGIGVIFGVAGGMLGAIVIFRRGNNP